jgi:hypothetical protein
MKHHASRGVRARGAVPAPKRTANAGNPEGRAYPGFFLRPRMKYVEKHFSLRIHRRDGTSKLLLGVTGHPPQIGSLKQIKIAKDEVLTIKIVEHPRRDEPAQAIEV